LAKPLRYKPYNPAWLDAFKQIRDLLYHHLEPYIIDILHIGSTSVVGLGAKPIIDIDIVYQDHLEVIIRILEGLGYRYEGTKGIPDRHAFTAPDGQYHEHHLYAVLDGSDSLNNHLSLQRALRNSPYYREQYMALKQSLINENNRDRERYTNRKTPFITTILKEESLMKSIVFAGGCFWGVEAYFKQLDGVKDTEVGYIGGAGEATYEAVCAGSGHAEAVHIVYDEQTISLNKLLDHLFNIIDPTSINKQGNDRGIQYRTGIYNYTKEDEVFIKNYLGVRQKEYRKPLQLELMTGLTFFKGEDYHQDYLDKHPNGYCHVNLKSYKKVK
jgi:methionine-S-sulfoxide reductase